MQAEWRIDSASLSKWKKLVAENREKPIVKKRRRLNVHRIDIRLDKQEIWRILMGCQVTTQQPSGQGSAVAKFLAGKSPAVRLNECRKARSVAALVSSECSAAGLRFGPKTGSNMQRIFDSLENGGWSALMEQLRSIHSHTTANKERAVIRYLRETQHAGKHAFPGLGPKQARNFIQWLGLSRYEIPIDSRSLRKMRELGSTFNPGGSALSDEKVYGFVQDALQQVARKLDIYPCELDATIFASFEVNSDEEAAIEN